LVTVFLGAGFSAIAGVPLAGDLFDEDPAVDRVTRRRLIDRVLVRWRDWRDKTNGTPEEYLAYLQNNAGKDFFDVVWYVGLVIALRMGQVEYVGMNPTITRHNLNRTTGNHIHEAFWSLIFRRTKDVTVITTNYDILPERGLRNQPRPRVPRPGFQYGSGVETLEGGGYPSYAHIQKITVSGAIPLLKLHGSISWSFRKGKLIRYHDCRPAIRGDAAIVAPVTEKSLPEYLIDTWKLAAIALSTSKIWIFVGYSLPEYDQLTRKLLRDNSSHRPIVHIFDPKESVGKQYNALLELEVSTHPGLPQGLDGLEGIL